MTIRSQAGISTKSSMFTCRISALVVACCKTLFRQALGNGLARCGEYTTGEYTTLIERVAS